MTKEELWKLYTKRNPAFNGDGNVTMTAKGLRKLFDTTWDTAFYDGEEEAAQPPITPSGSLSDLLNIFKMR